MLLGRFWQSLEKGGGKCVGKGGVKGELPGATALKTDKKKKQEWENPSLFNPSLRVRASGCGNPARNFKVPLIKKATGIEDVLTLLFKDHLQSIGSLLYPNSYPSMGDTVSHPFIHNGQQRPQQLLGHVYAFKQKQRDKGRHPEKHTFFKPSKN